MSNKRWFVEVLRYFVPLTKFEASIPRKLEILTAYSLLGTMMSRSHLLKVTMLTPSF